MTQKERLANLLDEFWLEHYDCCNTDAMTDHLLSHGVIVPPCKVGDILYLHCKQNIIRPVEVFGFEVKKDCTLIVNFIYLDEFRLSWFIRADEFGKRIFLTREAAEQALKEHE